MTGTGALPLFPLQTVLFPGGLLPLRIFEPRYVAMVGQVMRTGGVFGVIRLRAGGETGAAQALESIGTTARIVDFGQLADGLLGLTCRGERRFRVLERTQQQDGLHVGRIQWLPEAPKMPLTAGQQPLAGMLRNALASLGEAATRHLQPDYDSCGWVADRLIELLPLEPAQRQSLLELDDPQQRLDALLPLLDADDAH